jgi:cobalt-zinc-cadmium resistance protein CzcA
MLAVSLAAVPYLGSEFLPELNEGTTWANIFLPAGISLPETQKVMAKVRDRLRQFPEVR